MLPEISAREPGQIENPMLNYGSFLEDTVIAAEADREYRQESARKAHPPTWDAFPMLLFSNRWLTYSDDKKEIRM